MRSGGCRETEDEADGMGCWCAEREVVCSWRSNARGPAEPALLEFLNSPAPSLDPLELALAALVLPELPPDAEAGRVWTTTPEPLCEARIVYLATWLPLDRARVMDEARVDRLFEEFDMRTGGGAVAGNLSVCQSDPSRSVQSCSLTRPSSSPCTFQLASSSSSVSPQHSALSSPHLVAPFRPPAAASEGLLRGDSGPRSVYTPSQPVIMPSTHLEASQKLRFESRRRGWISKSDVL